MCPLIASPPDVFYHGPRAFDYTISISLRSSRWGNPSYTSIYLIPSLSCYIVSLGKLLPCHTSDTESKLSISCMPKSVQARSDLYYIPRALSLLHYLNFASLISMEQSLIYIHILHSFAPLLYRFLSETTAFVIHLILKAIFQSAVCQVSAGSLSILIYACALGP